MLLWWGTELIKVAINMTGLGKEAMDRRNMDCLLSSACGPKEMTVIADRQHVWFGLGDWTYHFQSNEITLELILSSHFPCPTFKIDLHFRNSYSSSISHFDYTTKHNNPCSCPSLPERRDATISGVETTERWSDHSTIFLHFDWDI